LDATLRLNAAEPILGAAALRLSAVEIILGAVAQILDAVMALLGAAVQNGTKRRMMATEKKAEAGWQSLNIWLRIAGVLVG
jgi:hypothetical protein